MGRIIEDWLTKNGFNIIAVSKVNPEMSDVDIIKLATIENAIIIKIG